MFDEVEETNSSPTNSTAPTPAPLPANESMDAGTEQIHTMPMEYYLGKETVSATKGATFNAPVKSAVAPESKKKILNFLIIGGVVILVGVSSFLLIKSFEKPQATTKPTVVNNQPLPKITPIPAEEPKVEEVVKIPEVVVQEPPTSNREKFDPNNIKKFSLSLLASNDEDRDGLTDNEEILFGTNQKLVDTDGDVYKDKEEIKNFYSPINAKKIRLWEEKLISTYENKNYGYKIYYPASWIIDSIDPEDPADIMVSSSQNEFVNIIVEEKRAVDSLSSWYLAKAPSVKFNEIKGYKNYNKLAVIESPDAFTVYIENVDKTKVFVINYNIGLKEEAGFGSVFEMIVNGFQFIDIASNLEPEESKIVEPTNPLAVEPPEELGESVRPPIIID